MKRSIVAFLVGIVIWIPVATILNLPLRLFLTGYGAAERSFNFTPGMMVARLTIGALTSLIAGALVARIAPAATRLPWLVGAILLAVLIADHVYVWQKFPLWYHLTFLITLLPLVLLGAHLARGLTAARAAA